MNFEFVLCDERQVPRLPSAYGRTLPCLKHNAELKSGNMPVINLSTIKSKWKKRDERAARELALKRKQEEDHKRHLEEKERQAAERRRKNARIPHYGGVISTNKNIAMKKFLLRKLSTGTDTMSATQMEAFAKLKEEIGQDVSSIRSEICRNTKHKDSFETIVHKIPVITTSDVVEERRNEEKQKHTKVVSLRPVKSDLMSGGSRSLKRRKTQVEKDDFLHKGLDELSATGKRASAKRAFKGVKRKHKSQTKIAKEKNRNFNQGNNKNDKGTSKKHIGNSKRQGATGAKIKKRKKQHENDGSRSVSSNRFDAFLTMSLDDICSSKNRKGKKRSRT